MLDKNDLNSIKKHIDSFEKGKDAVIAMSRDVVKLSKKVIYAVHRNNLKDAANDIKHMKTDLQKLTALASTPKLRFSGSYKVAVQEFVEAVCFYEFVKNKRIPTNNELKLEPEFYLLGLIDLVGELVRNAINSAIKENYKKALEIEIFVSDLYDELMQFDFAGGELRKKFDSVKYDLKKLEDLVLNLKMSGKI